MMIQTRLWYRRDDESGLTTLEWLLIVAAVAGLAALAVVLVTNVVDDTAEQIGGNSARETAARVAAVRITDEAYAEEANLDKAHRAPLYTGNNAGKAAAVQAAVNKLITSYTEKCALLEITYGDIEGLESTWQLSSVNISGTDAATVLASIKSQWTANLDEPSTEGCTVTIS